MFFPTNTHTHTKYRNNKNQITKKTELVLTSYLVFDLKSNSDYWLLNFIESEL